MYSIRGLRFSFSLPAVHGAWRIDGRGRLHSQKKPPVRVIKHLTNNDPSKMMILLFNRSSYLPRKASWHFIVNTPSFSSFSFFPLGVMPVSPNPAHRCLCDSVSGARRTPHAPPPPPPTSLFRRSREKEKSPAACI